MTTEPPGTRDSDEEEDEEEDDTYVSPEGQGCFSFRQSLLLRAKDTYAARCTGNKYEIISKWLLTGLAVVLSRPNWQILGTLTSTPQYLLQRYYRQGHPAGLTDKTKLPYALPWHNAISDVEWQHKVGWFSYPSYLHDMEAVYAERAGSRFEAFYRTMDLTNPIKAIYADKAETEPTNAATEHTTAAASASSGSRSADRPAIVSADAQSKYGQAKAAATGSNRY